jgi:hypothetical protein
LTALKAVNKGLRLNETDIKGVVGADIGESNKAMCVETHILTDMVRQRVAFGVSLGKVNLSTQLL